MMIQNTLSQPFNFFAPINHLNPRAMIDIHQQYQHQYQQQNFQPIFQPNLQANPIHQQDQHRKQGQQQKNIDFFPNSFVSSPNNANNSPVECKERGEIECNGANLMDLPSIPTLFITESLIKGNIKRRKFIKEEDQRLAKLVEIFGTKSWGKIAQYMPLRNERQCKERFQTYLSPDLNLNNWTKEEDDLLIQKYEEIGPKWVQMTKFFVGRSDNNLKNRWYTHLSRQPEFPTESDPENVGNNYNKNDHKTEVVIEEKEEKKEIEDDFMPIIVDQKENGDSAFFETMNIGEEESNYFDSNFYTFACY